MSNPFVLSIETDAGAYQYGFHLGTEERMARACAEEVYLHTIPKIGKRIVTVALKHDGRMVDVFDGEWMTDALDRLYAEEVTCG